MSSKRNVDDDAPAPFSRMAAVIPSFEEEPVPEQLLTLPESTIPSLPHIRTVLDPEFIVSAMEELKEFAAYHFLPLMENLTSDHIEAFLRSALVKPSSS